MAAKKQNTIENEVKSPGKFMITLGGFIGFIMPFSASLAAGNTPWSSLLYGGFGCVICAFLMQRFAIYIEKNIDRIRKEKVEAERRRRMKAEIEDENEGSEENTEIIAPR
jgi:uncharacterized membrane protein YjfL (UPF0719 family)